MTLRRSKFRLWWEPLLSGADITQWLEAGKTKTLTEKLKTDPGVYRWLFSAQDSEKGCAYVGEAKNLSTRLSEYLDEARRQIRNAESSGDSDSSTAEPERMTRHSAARYIDPSKAKEALENRTEVEVEARDITDHYQVLEDCLKANHRWANVRVGAQLARKHCSSCVELQRLQISEEGIICGVEISNRLFNDRLGRVFLEHWAILSTETEGKGYTMLNRSPYGRYVWGEIAEEPSSKREGHKESCL